MKKSYEWKKNVTNERRMLRMKEKCYERKEKKFRRKRKKGYEWREKKRLRMKRKKGYEWREKKRLRMKRKKRLRMKRKKVTNEEKKKVTNEEKKGYVWGVSALYCCAVWSHGPPIAIPFGHRCTVGVNRDPPVCWSTQAGRWINNAPTPLAAALMLHCTELDTCVRVRPYWTCCHKHTPSVECTCRESRPIRPALCRTVHLQSELVGGGIFHIPCHARWAIYLQHQLVIFVAITRVTVHVVNTIAGSTRIKPTIINDLRTPFHLLTTSIWKSEA